MRYVVSMHLRTSPEGALIAQDGVWISLRRALEATTNDDPRLAFAARDALALMRADEAVRAEAQAIVAVVAGDESVAADPAQAGLPFVPRSMRAFMLWESHVINSGRMLVKHFFPAPVWKLVSTFEKTGRTFPKLKPNQRFWDAPTFYVANHTMVLAEGQEMWWPSHTRFLDFELELACVLCAPLVDATPAHA